MVQRYGERLRLSLFLLGKSMIKALFCEKMIEPMENLIQTTLFTFKQECTIIRNEKEGYLLSQYTPISEIQAEPLLLRKVMRMASPQTVSKR